ncbi:unnamed protein product, partial [Mycena citricolor]
RSHTTRATFLVRALCALRSLDTGPRRHLWNLLTLSVASNDVGLRPSFMPPPHYFNRFYPRVNAADNMRRATTPAGARDCSRRGFEVPIWA